MQILQTPFIPSQLPHTLSSSNSTTSATSQLSLLPKLTSLSLTHHTPLPSLFIRCGGGPRTYPGGVSKWQWKRMQSKKAKQLLKARLARERSIYEMRKRAELKAAVSNLERPWEIVNTNTPTSPSSLFSVSADEQLKVLADRFQKPGGFDLWSQNDGPQVFHRGIGTNGEDDDDDDDLGLPSSRFFPKGVVHSVKPYGKIDGGDEQSKDGGNRKGLKAKMGRRLGDGDSRVKGGIGNHKEEVQIGSEQGLDAKRGDKGSIGGGRNGRSLKNKRGYGRGQNSGKRREFNGESEGEGVYDMSLQGDGSYGFSENKE